MKGKREVFIGRNEPYKAYRKICSRVRDVIHPYKIYFSVTPAGASSFILLHSFTTNLSPLWGWSKYIDDCEGS